MANPAETTPTPTPDPGFDALEFWIRNKGKIVLLVGLFILATVIYGIYEFTERRTHEAASRAFATAQSVEDYRKIIAEYPSSPAAENAYLMLADRLRTDGKLDESTQTLRDFIAKFPESSLAAGGLTSLGANLEQQSKLDEALATYQKVTTSYPTSFSAPVAWLAQGRILKEQGKADQAKRAFETVISQFGDSLFAQEASRQNAQLKK